MKGLLKILAGLVLLRFAAGELAAYASRHWIARVPEAVDLPTRREADTG